MLNGLVETIRFGFSPINPPASPGLGAGAQFKTQAGLPPAGIRFGFKPRGTVGGATGTGSGVPHHQAGLPPDAIRFGFKPRGSAGAVIPVVPNDTGTILMPGKSGPPISRKKLRKYLDEFEAEAAAERAAILAEEKNAREAKTRAKQEATEARAEKIRAKAQETADKRLTESLVASAASLQRAAKENARIEAAHGQALALEIARQEEDEDEIMMLLLS